MKARNKTQLAACLGYGRNSLYSFMRLDGFPKPDSRGQWDVASCRKFILKQAKRMHGPNERDRLQAELLSLKVEKAAKDLSGFEQTIRSEIQAEYCERVRVFTLGLSSELIRLADEIGRHFNNRDVSVFGKKSMAETLNRYADRVMREGLGVKETQLTSKIV